MQKITREELYQLVWSAPTQQIARQLGVSDVYVGHVCIALDVPKPPRGWWIKKRSGAPVAQPPLATPRPGHPTFWIRGQKASIRPFREAAGHISPAIDGFHPLVRLSGMIDSFGPPHPRGTCLVPRHRRSIDLTVTPDRFVEALRFANNLFLDLEARGHRVSVIPGRRVVRPPIDVWEHPPAHFQSRQAQLCSPRWPTVATLGDVAIGLAIVETHGEQEMQYIGDGQYRPLLDPKRSRSARVAGISWIEWQMQPQGRLRLVAYSLERNWRNEWSLEPRKATRHVGGIVDDIQNAAEMLREQPMTDGSIIRSTLHVHSTTSTTSDANGLSR